VGKICDSKLFVVCFHFIYMLIFVHGINAHADEWQPFIKYFSERNFSCKAVNLREGLNLRKTRFRDYVNKVKAMVTPEDIVIGHSMGGLIVQKIAEETTIRGGIAICPAPPRGIKLSGIRLSSSLRYLPNIIIKKPFKINFSFYTKYLLNCLGEKESREIYEDQIEESAIVHYEIAMNKIAVDESKVKCPLFFIATKDDRACPSEMVGKIAEKYNADFKVYNGCHHIFANWQDIAEGIQNFMTKLWLM